MSITLKTAFQKWMASAIKFWMSLIFKNSLPKWMTSTIQFWMDIMLNDNLPKKDDHIHPILDDY